MVFEFARKMSKLEEPKKTLSDKRSKNQWKLKPNFYFILTHVIVSLILFTTNPTSVDGKVLTSQKYYVNKGTGEEDTRKNLHEILDEYYEDSFEDLVTHNFVEEYDTDGEVRFITEDDVEESFKDEGEDFPSRGARIAHLDPRCPDLPQPSKLTTNLCQAKSCLSDEDCRYKSASHSTSSFVCCFNGCVHSCLIRVDPPKAFDWIEDTGMRRIHKNGTMDSNIGASTLNPKAIFTDDQISFGKINLPGGCHITQKQLDELKLFRKYDHVEVCTCLNGEVVCQINPKVAIKPDELQGSRLPI